MSDEQSNLYAAQDRREDAAQQPQEPKPCPFCGNTTAVHVTTDEEFEETSNGYYLVTCDYRKGGCGCGSGFKRNPADAVKLWNTRAIDAALGPADTQKEAGGATAEQHRDIPVQILELEEDIRRARHENAATGAVEDTPDIESMVEHRNWLMSGLPNASPTPQAEPAHEYAEFGYCLMRGCGKPLKPDGTCPFCGEVPEPQGTATPRTNEAWHKQAERIAALERELASVKEQLPTTFYAHLPLNDRLAMFVHQWQKLVPLCQQLDADRDALRAECEETRRQLGDIANRISHDLSSDEVTGDIRVEFEELHELVTAILTQPETKP